MMSESNFNRDEYAQGASFQAIRAINEDAEKHNKKFYEDQNRVGYHEIKEGLNVFRIAPAHDPLDSPYMPVRFSRLDVSVEEYDQQGNKTGNKIWRKRKCYVSTQHGPRDQKGNSIITNDIIEYYIEFLTKQLKEQGLSDKEKEKMLAPVHGFWLNGKFNWGIRPESKYICYAWNSTGELKQLELSKPWYAEMEALIIQASQNTKIAVDIFSHIDNGIPLIIEKVVYKESGKKTKTEYKIRKDEPNMATRESWEAFFERTKITNEQMKELLEKKSLKVMYRENYSMDDFEKVVIGLKRFDETWKNNLFANDKFLKGVAMIESKLKKSIKPKEEETTTELTTDQMLAQIIDYVSTTYDNKYELPTLNKHEIMLCYQMILAGEMIPVKFLKPVQGAKLENIYPDDLPFDQE